MRAILVIALLALAGCDDMPTPLERQHAVEKAYPGADVVLDSTTTTFFFVRRPNGEILYVQTDGISIYQETRIFSAK